ncbi:MAG: c-type cytochrome [Chloroflexi bacterium]|nr:c-type cytochrome [Chloroflexota bacterium]
MSKRVVFPFAVLAAIAMAASACSSPNPQPTGLTPIPTLPPGATPTLVTAIESVPSAEVNPSASGGDPASGAPIFLQNCSPCHGLNGQGVNGPALRDNTFVQNGGSQVYQTIAEGHPGTAMPAWLQANGGPLDAAQIDDVIAYLGTLQNVTPQPTSTPMATETPEPANAPTPEPAQPSEPGGPGPAVSLVGDPSRGQSLFGQYCASCHGPEGLQGAPNPDSDDGSVPTLNPIDPTIANPDPKVFATNIDLFVEHGSVPSGENPLLRMPSFGDSKMLSAQQIADIISYVAQLNKAK